MKKSTGSMLTPGDVIELDLGTPSGSQAGLIRPAVVVTAGRVLHGNPNVVQVVPLTRTIRESGAEVVVDPDDHNGLGSRSSAQCQHVRSVAVSRVSSTLGNVGPVALGQIRNTLAVLLDL